jgi:hypothetical protein
MKINKGEQFNVLDKIYKVKHLFEKVKDCNNIFII